jgi:hypothetical protein
MIFRKIKAHFPEFLTPILGHVMLRLLRCLLGAQRGAFVKNKKLEEIFPPAQVMSQKGTPGGRMKRVFPCTCTGEAGRCVDFKA